jgi:hypothetical protein
MILTRRNILIGASCLVAAPAIVKYENIMKIHDPLVRGVRFQSWPFGEQHPLYHIGGSICVSDKHGQGEVINLGSFSQGFDLRKDRLSTFLPNVYKHNAHWENVYWKEIW